MGRVFLIFVATVLIFGAVAAFELKQFSGNFVDRSLSNEALYPIVIGGTHVYVRLATTTAQQAQGLSGTPSLPQDQGMLFVFPSEGTYAFWMKDMDYPLDIIWIDGADRIVYIAPDLSPDTYPQSFASTAPARMVLEVNAGFSAANNIRVGEYVQIQ